MINDLPNQDLLALRRLEAEVANGRIHVYRTLLGRLYVFFDIVEARPADAHPAVHLPLYHDDVRSWLPQFFWKAVGVLLHRREIDRVLQALAGLSLRNKIDQATDPDLLEVMRRCKQASVVINVRAGRLRVSPHCYNTFAEIDHFLECVRSA